MVGAVWVTAGGGGATFSAVLPKNHQASAASTSKATSGHSQRGRPPPDAAAAWGPFEDCDRKALTCGGIPVGDLAARRQEADDFRHQEAQSRADHRGHHAELLRDAVEGASAESALHLRNRQRRAVGGPQPGRHKIAEPGTLQAVDKPADAALTTSHECKKFPDEATTLRAEPVLRGDLFDDLIE